MAINLGTISKRPTDWLTTHISFQGRGAPRTVYAELGISGKTISARLTTNNSTDWASYNLALTMTMYDEPSTGNGGRVAPGSYAVYAMVWDDPNKANTLWKNADDAGRQQPIGTLVVGT